MEGSDGAVGTHRSVGGASMRMIFRTLRATTHSMYMLGVFVTLFCQYEYNVHFLSLLSTCFFPARGRGRGKERGARGGGGCPVARQEEDSCVSYIFWEWTTSLLVVWFCWFVGWLVYWLVDWFHFFFHSLLCVMKASFLWKKSPIGIIKSTYTR